jgi:hypothetical protein
MVIFLNFSIELFFLFRMYSICSFQILLVCMWLMYFLNPSLTTASSVNIDKRKLNLHELFVDINPRKMLIHLTEKISIFFAG